MPIVLKSGSLNLLECSGPVKACNEIDLPFYYFYFSKGKGKGHPRTGHKVQRRNRGIALLFL
jgi:hypothetical protein